MNETPLALPASAAKRGDKFIEDIKQQILNIGLLQEGALTVHKQLSMYGGVIYYQLCFCGERLNLDHGDDVLVALTFDDLIEQLDQIKIIAVFGGFDGALATWQSVT
jgi:hypothetical protein